MKKKNLSREKLYEKGKPRMDYKPPKLVKYGSLNKITKSLTYYPGFDQQDGDSSVQ
jgi:hypothetical protein